MNAMNEYSSRIEQAFRNAFPDVNDFKPSFTKEESHFWDSIGHLNLIVELGDIFEISFTIEEIEKMNSTKEIENVIKTKNNE
jgi:acyl carrier protein